MRAVLVANGEIHVVEHILDTIGPNDLIVCADGGAARALALGLTPQVVIGDTDSMSPEVRRELEEAGTHFVVCSPSKDETDSELAMHYCVEQGASHILFLGALGDRLDHTLANLLLLAEPTWRAVSVRIMDGNVSVELCSSRCEITGKPGDIVSLLPWGGEVTGVQTSGLQYPLEDEPLPFGAARGVSNVMLGKHAVVTIRSGLLLVVHQAA
jgi:thiamine pyrophosphokinase